jgi:hypothetical protein
MRLKRRYDKGRVTHMQVQHTGLSPRQNFSDKLVEQGVDQGWIALDGRLLTLLAEPESLRYTVLRRPGYYCRSTGELIPLSERAMRRLAVRQLDAPRAEALAWLASGGLAADDYEVTLAYECELDAEQHSRFRAVRDAAGNVVAAHTLEG